MLTEIAKFEDLDPRSLMDIYRESNGENAEYFHPDMDKTEALAPVEAGFPDFLRKDFFNGVNRYYVLEEGGVRVSALRLTPVREGFYYLEAPETHPDCRRRGYGARVLAETLKFLEKSGPFEVRDCVNKKNEASLAAHRKCGFVIDSDTNIYLKEDTERRGFFVSGKEDAAGNTVCISKAADATGVPGGQSPLGRGGAEPAPEPD